MSANRKFSVGEEILMAGDMDDPKSIRKLKVIGIGKPEGGMTTIQTTQGIYFSAFCWPVRVEAELRQILEQRATLKKALDDSMKLVYDLSNRITRGEV